MGKKTGTYFSLVRVAWMVIAVAVLLLCGPVKRLMELDTAASLALTTQNHTFKKHKSASYERRNVPPKGIDAASVHYADHDLILSPPTFLLFMLPFLKRSEAPHPQYLSAVIGIPIPLYLQHHRWQV